MYGGDLASSAAVSARVALLPALDGGLTVAGHDAAGTTGTMVVDLQSEAFDSRRVMILRAVGAFLILLGVAEFVVFTFLAPAGPLEHQPTPPTTGRR